MHDFPVQPWESPAPSRLANARDGPALTPACSGGIPSPSPPWTGSAATGLNWWPSWSPCTSAGWASPPLAPAESWLHPLGAHPTEVEQMMGEIVLRVMAG